MRSTTLRGLLDVLPIARVGIDHAPLVKVYIKEDQTDDRRRLSPGKL